MGDGMPITKYLYFQVVQELNLTREQWNAITLNGNNAFHFVAQTVSSKTVEYFELLKEKGVEIKVFHTLLFNNLSLTHLSPYFFM